MLSAIDPVVDLTLRGCLALLLASAAFHKLRDPAAFGLSLLRYDLLPAALVPAAATLLICVEVALAATLLFAGAAPAGAAVLLAAYGAAMAVNLRRGRFDLDCGCAGPGASTPISAWLVARNAVLAATALMLTLPVADRPLVWIDAVTLVAATSALSACWLASERLLALVPRMSAVRAPLRPEAADGHSHAASALTVAR